MHPVKVSDTADATFGFDEMRNSKIMDNRVDSKETLT